MPTDLLITWWILIALGLFWYLLKGLLKGFWWPFRSLKLVKYSQSYGPNEVYDISFFVSNFLISSSRSIPSITTSIPYIALTSNHFFFTSTLSLLSLFMPIFQSGCLLRLSAHPILLPGICFRWKSNLDRYRAHCACLLFNFWLLIKYSRFLWLLQFSNLSCVPSSKCLHSSRYLMIANISLSWIS